MKKLLFLVSFLFVVLKGYSQPPCGSNPAAGNDCANATAICELNGYCGNTSSSYTPDAWGSTGSILGCGFLGLSSCPGNGLINEFCGSVENDSYLKFVAASSSISFNVWVTTSQFGDGIQLIVFSTPSCGNNSVTSYYCQQITPGGGPTIVSVGGLTPGNTYYIMIDGFAGDVCDYVIGANTGISIPVDINPATATICSGGTVNLTASGGNGTYTWNATPQLNTTAGANVTATPPGPGTYTYTVNSATGNPLCPSSTTASAIVTVTSCGCTVTASNSGNVCPGGSANLFATTVSGATYSWTGPGGFTSTDQNPTGLVLPTTPGTYMYTVTADDGGTPCTSSTTITVNPLPTVSAGSNQSICIGTSITLSGSGASTYSWDNGVTDGVSFTPSVGTVVYTVTGTSTANCSNTAQVTVTVNALPVVDAGTYGPICTDASSISLVGIPVGGTFSGTGVTGSSFNPTAGTQVVTYSFTDGNTCSASAITTITVNSLPTVNAGAYGPVCADAASVTLVGSPVGGTFSGTGVTGSSFDPTSGTQTITYSFTDGNSCANSATTTIMVNQLPTVSAGSYPTVCSNSGLLTLVGNPIGGTFSGTGVTGLAFDPTIGSQTVTYNYTDGNGCSNTSSTAIVVVNPSTINAGTYAPVCQSTPTVSLVGTPAGGTFSGVGVTGSTFNTSSGTQTITYTYTDGNGCGGSATTTITVNTLPAVNAGTYSAVCIDAANVSLTGSPIGGTFSGTGVTGSTFDPSVGSQTINYVYTDGNGCSNTSSSLITVNSLPVVNAGTYSPVCIDAPNINLTGSPIGGSFSGVGVSANSFDPSVGSQSVTYSYTDGNGCSNTTTSSITVNPLPLINAGASQTICLGSSVILSGSGGVTYTWNNGVINNQAFQPALGNNQYTVTGTDANGCVNTSTVNVTVLPVPVADVSSTDPLIGYPGLTIDFDNSSQNATSYSIDFGNGDSDNSTAISDVFTSTYSTPGSYVVILTASNGVCSDTAQMQVLVEPYEPVVIQVPNIFTPNGDGTNDHFYITATNAVSMEVIIENRWGNKMAEINTLDGKWSGDGASEGTYFFQYTIIGIDGNTLKGQGMVQLAK